MLCRLNHASDQKSKGDMILEVFKMLKDTENINARKFLDLEQGIRTRGHCMH